jgi:hypothetical protein
LIVQQGEPLHPLHRLNKDPDSRTTPKFETVSGRFCWACAGELMKAAADSDAPAATPHANFMNFDRILIGSFPCRLTLIA